MRNKKFTFKQKKMRQLWIAILILCTCIVCVTLSFYLSLSSKPQALASSGSAVPSVAPTVQAQICTSAEDVVKQFYTDITVNKYDDAYIYSLQIFGNKCIPWVDQAT
jgi:flagellar basal body-associated protein FliL